MSLNVSMEKDLNETSLQNHPLAADSEDLRSTVNMATAKTSMYEYNDDLLDLDYLQRLLDEDVNTSVRVEAMNAANLTSQDECNALKSGDETHVRPESGEKGKEWVRRKRYKKGTPEYYRRKQETKIKNRVAAARSLARKQAYVSDLELQIIHLRRENAIRTRLLQLQERDQRMKGQLRRTASGPT